MNNLYKLNSTQLREDILSIENDIYDNSFLSIAEVHNHIHSKYVFGIGGPMCISDVTVIGDLDDFTVYLGVNYKVTYCYKPHQDLDSDLIFTFDVNKESKRDRKLNSFFV